SRNNERILRSVSSRGRICCVTDPKCCSLVVSTGRSSLPCEKTGQVDAEGEVRHMTSVLPRTELQLEIDGGSLSIEDVVAVARGGVFAGLSHDAVGRIEEARELKRALIEREVPIYGVTTGFGDSAHRQ